MGTTLNVKVEPVDVFWGGTACNLGFTDGDIELTTEEQLADVVCHQEGTNLMSQIRTGKSVEIGLALKETTVIDVRRMILAGGGDTGTAEETDIQFEGDTAGNKDAAYWTFDTPARSYYVWYDLDAGSTDPAPAGRTGIKVAISTGDSAATIATAAIAAINAAAGCDVTAATSGSGTDFALLTNVMPGAVADAVDGSASGIGVTVNTQGVNGTSGWGSSQDFTQTLSDARKLVLHPVVLDATDLSRDWAFFKTYPVLGSITHSGESPMVVNVTFRCYPDTSKAAGIRLFNYGDSSL